MPVEKLLLTPHLHFGKTKQNNTKQNNKNLANEVFSGFSVKHNSGLFIFLSVLLNI